jgi:addiction module HigA family antidote
MIPESRIPTHPGVVLSEEFLRPLGVTQEALAAHLGVPVYRINELARGKRGMSPKTAWLLAQALNTTPEYWMNLQVAHDLALSRPTGVVEPLVAVGRQIRPAKSVAPSVEPTKEVVEQLAALFKSNGYIRRQSEERLAEEGPHSYKKGEEVRFTASSEAELEDIRRLLSEAGFRLGKSYGQKSQLRQPVYGRDQVRRLMQLIGVE